MNSLVLLMIAVVVFAFGYRFYSKLLELGVFRLVKDYSTPSPDRPAEAEPGAFGRHLIFGHHVASLAAGAAVTGCITSLIWGWVPAFLWAVVGTVVAAGTYGLGALWLSLRYPGRNPAEIAARLLGSPAHGLFALVAFLLLLIMNAACATLAAQLLSVFPASVLPFWIITAMALFLGNFLRGREDFEIIPATLIALTLSLMVVWLLGNYPLSLTGALHLETAESYFPFDATVVWVMLLFAYGYYVTRLPMWKLMRPRGYLTALLLGVTLFIFYTAVMIDQPSLVAPEFHAGPGIPDALPWLFVTLTSGAVAGLHLLVANAVTARHAAGLGLDLAFARSLMAVVILGLLVATLEAGLRAQKQLLAGLSERYPAFVPGNEKALIATAVGLSALLSLHDGHGRGGLTLWPLLGVADQFLALLGFALLTVALRSLERPVSAVLLPLVFLLVTANWGLGALMTQWWSDNRWLLLLLGILLIATELGVTFLTLNALKSPRPPQT